MSKVTQLSKSEFANAIKTTCKHATEMLKSDEVFAVRFRPNGIINYNDPDRDLAFVWTKED